MKNPEISKAIVQILWSVGGVYMRESVLGDETEIRLRRGLSSDEFRRELASLRSDGLVTKDIDPFGEATYTLTAAGRDAARRL